MSRSGKSAFRWRSFENCTAPVRCGETFSRTTPHLRRGNRIKKQEAEFGAREGGLESVLKGKIMIMLSEPRTDTGAVAMTDEEKWQAVAAKDPNADGKFFYSVKTTGIYCLPSCRSRSPLRKNVAFHGTAEAAEKAGLRACKRCQPTGPSKVDLHEAAVAKACRL